MRHSILYCRYLNNVSTVNPQSLYSVNPHNPLWRQIRVLPFLALSKLHPLCPPRLNRVYQLHLSFLFLPSLSLSLSLSLSVFFLSLTTPTTTMLLLLFTLLVNLAAASLTINIPPSAHLPNPNVLPATTHATLTTSNQEHILSASLTRSSTLVFRNIPSGHPESYLLDIRSSEFIFAPYRVDVAADGSILGVWETFRGNPWDNRGAEKYVVDVANKRTVNVIVEAKVLGRKNFYQERAKCE